MGMTNPQLKVEGEESATKKTAKYTGETTFFDGHNHKFVVYEDDSVEVFPIEGIDHHKNHTHIYHGDYPNGFILEGGLTKRTSHFHKIISINTPIDIKKTVYGKKSYSKNIDKGFNELFNKSEKVNLDEFFESYDDLFYEIPKEGKQSHTFLVQESLDYLEDFKSPQDEEIEALLERIVELETQLAQQGEAEPQHPFFSNGSFLQAPDNPTIYFMERGEKRGIANWPTFELLSATQGYPVSQDAKYEAADVEHVMSVQQNILEGIPNGPKFTEDDFNPNREEAEKEKLIQLDPDDFKVDPENYGSTEDYLEALDRETRQKLNKESYLEELYHRYKYESENITDNEERADARDRFKEVKEDLRATRNAIIRYTKILEAVDPDGDLKNIKIDTSKLKNIVTEKMEEEVTTDEKREQLYGKNRIERFIKDMSAEDRANAINSTSPPSERDLGAETGGILGGGDAASQAEAYLGSTGISLPEEQPTYAPPGFTENPKGTKKNRSLNEMVRLSKMGQSSPKGEWYWGPKKDYENKLENPLWNLPLSPVKISKYMWKRKHFEWIPKAAPKRLFHGRNVDKLS
jgi:hypothetical protein